MTEKNLANALWLQDEPLQKLLEVLSQEGEEARIVGGAVRNTLLGEPINDVDIATTTVPEETIRRAESVGFKTVPTGIRFGTVTVVADGRPYEVTTLRSDVETDGRRAKVVFGRDWSVDAHRRDFTINALYVDRHGRIYDDVGGMADIETRTIRFIGDADERIEEDYLRILRFFRFFAWYGAGRPDSEGLKACARLKENITQLSAERVWAEIKKMLSAPDPSRALLWMRQSGVLTLAVPETEKWGIQAIHSVVATGAAFGWPHDALLRLMSLLPPDQVRMKVMAKRLKFSKTETARIMNWAACDAVLPNFTDLKLQKLIYRRGRQPVLDRLRLAMAAMREKALYDVPAMSALSQYAALLGTAGKWVIPTFPLKGEDLLSQGYAKGPALGDALKKLENRWVESGFTLDEETLLNSLKNQKNNTLL